MVVSLKYWFLKQFSSFSRKAVFLFSQNVIIRSLMKSSRKGKKPESVNQLEPFSIRYFVKGFGIPTYFCFCFSFSYLTYSRSLLGRFGMKNKLHYCS